MFLHVTTQGELAVLFQQKGEDHFHEDPASVVAIRGPSDFHESTVNLAPCLQAQYRLWLLMKDSIPSYSQKI